MHRCYRGHAIRGRILEGVKRGLTCVVANVSCSNYVARNIPGASIVIPNPYDDSLFRAMEGTTRDSDFVFCGRLVSDKGGELLIWTFADVAKVVPGTQLTIVGDGPERGSLEGLVLILGVADKVRFRGALRDQALVRELRRHRCLAVPSRREEPLGLTALEGIA